MSIDLMNSMVTDFKAGMIDSYRSCANFKSVEKTFYPNGVIKSFSIQTNTPNVLGAFPLTGLVVGVCRAARGVFFSLTALFGYMRSQPLAMRKLGRNVAQVIVGLAEMVPLVGTACHLYLYNYYTDSVPVVSQNILLIES